jgi:hypothetical protein
MKLCKLEVNDKPVFPEGSSHNANDSSYLNAVDGKWTVHLPIRLRKMQFVFWNAKLTDLVFTCEVT